MLLSRGPRPARHAGPASGRDSARNFVSGRGASRGSTGAEGSSGLLIPVDVHDASVPRQLRDQPPQEGDAPVHVVVGVDEHRHVTAATRQERVVVAAQHGGDVPRAAARQPPAQHVQHGCLRIDRVDVAPRTNGARQPRREVARARADLRHHLPTAQPERPHEDGRLLPGRASRVQLPAQRAAELFRCHRGGPIWHTPRYVVKPSLPARSRV